MTQTAEACAGARWRTPGARDDLAALDDHELLAGGLVDQVLANRANGRTWARLAELHARRVADDAVRRAQSWHFALRPRQAVVAEVAQLWGWQAGWVRSQLNVALCLSLAFPDVWRLCLAGQLDAHRARMIADVARFKLDGDELLWWRLAERLQPWLEGHLRSVDATLPDGSPAPPVVTCTVKQLRNKLDYEVRRLAPAASEAAHRKAVEDRAVRRSETADGTAVGWLGISHTVDQLMTAEHALTLAARQLREAGDDRTLDQLRADIAVDPDSTWHRMLVDPAGAMIELSTKSYAPTPPIWRHVIAQWGGCFRPGCDEPATTSETDHRVPFPRGATSTGNLWPACEEDHKAKHAPGFSLSQDAGTGSYVVHTPAGFSHDLPMPTQPVCDWARDLPEAIQISGSELVHALHHVMAYRESDLPCDPAVEWEVGPDDEISTIIRHEQDRRQRVGAPR